MPCGLTRRHSPKPSAVSVVNRRRPPLLMIGIASEHGSWRLFVGSVAALEATDWMVRSGRLTRQRRAQLSFAMRLGVRSFA